MLDLLGSSCMAEHVDISIRHKLRIASDGVWIRGLGRTEFILKLLAIGSQRHAKSGKCIDACVYSDFLSIGELRLGELGQTAELGRARRYSELRRVNDRRCGFVRKGRSAERA